MLHSLRGDAGCAAQARKKRVARSVSSQSGTGADATRRSIMSESDAAGPASPSPLPSPRAAAATADALGWQETRARRNAGGAQWPPARDEEVKEGREGMGRMEWGGLEGGVGFSLLPLASFASWVPLAFGRPAAWLLALRGGVLGGGFWCAEQIPRRRRAEEGGGGVGACDGWAPPRASSAPPDADSGSSGCTCCCCCTGVSGGTVKRT